MKIACLSGKGGAGKTFVAVNLAVTAGTNRGPVTYIDCDVEEPNGRLFLKSQHVSEEAVGKLLPEFDPELCNGCKKCVDFCRFHALIYIKEKPKVFSEVCHSCGGCKMVCPENAVTERKKTIGKIEIGHWEEISVVTGVLNPGEASGVPVIKEALNRTFGTTIIDCPPGSACSVMESVMDADYCILVTEPTAFGFHNFKMVHELVTLLDRRCGVVINKETVPYEPLEIYCKEKNIPILCRIPYDEQIAAMSASGQIVSKNHEKMNQLFEQLYRRILEEIPSEKGGTL